MNDTQTIKCADLRLLHSTVSRVIGRKCWKVAFTYGGELSLHFGRRLAYRQRKLAGKKTGAWRLGTRGTAWALFTPHGRISSKEADEKSIEQKLKVLEGRKVTRINVSVPDNVLTLAFGNDYLFQVTPSGHDARSKLPYWQLLMPNHQSITFGPDDSWSCRRSDVSVSRREKQDGSRTH